MIQVTDKYFIEPRGVHNFIVYERKTKEGASASRKDKEFTNPTYYTEMSEAVVNVIKRQQSDALQEKDTTLEEAIQIMKQVQSEMESKIKQAFDTLSQIPLEEKIDAD